MNERKPIGNAFMDVINSFIQVVKAEIREVFQNIGAEIKRRGLGIVILLGALFPLLAAVIFLLMGLYQLLDLWLPSWGASLVMFLLALLLTGGMVMFALKKIGGTDDDTNG